jgi:putative acetyltransferase
MEIQIRNEEIKDIEQVRQVVATAFPTDVESRLVDALRAHGKAIISLVAVHDDQVVGHILFSPVSTTPLTHAKGIGLAPVSVHPRAQSQGIGTRLVQEGLRLCKELGYDYCVVLGDPKYYSRFGFKRANDFGLKNEYGVDDEFMVIWLKECDPADGIVRYESEFAMFSV